jgi:hypothetical protein
MAVVAGFVALLVLNVSLDAQSVDRSALNGQQLYQAACAAAELSIDRAERSGGRIIAVVRVQNPTGHKLPTGYPSRRAWLHFTVKRSQRAHGVRIGIYRVERRYNRQRQRR